MRIFMSRDATYVERISKILWVVEILKYMLIGKLQFSAPSISLTPPLHPLNIRDHFYLLDIKQLQC